MSSTMQVKITLSGRAANKLLHVFIIYPTKSGPEMLLLLRKALISISAHSHQQDIEIREQHFSKRKTFILKITAAGLF